MENKLQLEQHIVDTLLDTVCPGMLGEPQTLDEMRVFLKNNLNKETTCITFIDNIIYKKTKQRNDHITQLNQISEQTSAMLKIVSSRYASIVETSKKYLPIETRSTMLLQTLEMIDLYDIYKKTNQNIKIINLLKTQCEQLENLIAEIKLLSTI